MNKIETEESKQQRIKQIIKDRYNDIKKLLDLCI